MIKTWRTEYTFVLNKKSKQNMPNLRFLKYWNSASFSRKTSEKHTGQFFLFCLKIMNSFCRLLIQFNSFYYFQPEKFSSCISVLFLEKYMAISALVEHQSQLCFFCFEAGEKGKKVCSESFECIDTLSANWEIPKSTELTFLNTTKLA